MKYLQIARSYRKQILGSRILAWVVLLGAAAWIIAANGKLAHAAAESTSRSVQGRVVNSTETPIRSAIVYLSDTRTMTVESYITQEDGAYRFEQISPTDDYKLWAQVDGRKSKIRTLSSFDDRSVFHVILKIPTGQ